MPKLTPNRQIKLRRGIIALMGNMNTKEAMVWCEAKNEELGNHLDVDTLLKIFESQGMVQFLDNSKKEVPKEEVLQSGESKLMSSLEYAEAKHSKNKSNKIQTKLIKEEYKNMKDFWDSQEDSAEFTPFLKIKTAVTYTLELIDNEADPRSGIDGYGNNQYIFDVILRKISPLKALEDINKDGFPLYQIGKEYAFAIKTPGRIKDRMKEMWDISGPVTTFSFKRTGEGFQTDYIYKKVN